MAIDKRDSTDRKYILLVNPDNGDTHILMIGKPVPSRLRHFKHHSAYKCYQTACNEAKRYFHSWKRERVG